MRIDAGVERQQPASIVSPQDFRGIRVTKALLFVHSGLCVLAMLLLMSCGEAGAGDSTEDSTDLPLILPGGDPADPDRPSPTVPELIPESVEGTPTHPAQIRMQPEGSLPPPSDGSAYPASPLLSGIRFEAATRRTDPNGSDNWVITWADDGHQYTSWGDGGGFGGTNQDGRVGLGFGRVEGGVRNYQGFNVWGGKSPENPAQFVGKSYGIISVRGVLYSWVSGVVQDGSTGSGMNAYLNQRLYVSYDHAAHWNFTGVEFTQSSFSSSKGFFVPTFLNFGKDNQGARDRYVYSYAPEAKDTGVWNVQFPGEITLMRVPASQIQQRSSYEFYSGKDGHGNPVWQKDVNLRQPVFKDEDNGVMRTSVTYVPGLKRYILITQHISRMRTASLEDPESLARGFAGDGHIGIYEAPSPWGPWSTVLFANAWTNSIHLPAEPKTTFWDISSKWLSSDGKDFVLVYSDSGSEPEVGGLATMEGHFLLR